MSFQSNQLFMESRRAGEDLTAKQFHFVKLNAAGRVVACDTVGERAYGVLLNAIGNNKVAQISRGPGGSDVVAGAVIAGPGVELTTNAAGRAIPATANKHYVNGIAMKAASADGTVIGANLATYQKNV